MEYNYISTGEYYSHGRGSTAHAIKNGKMKSIEKAAKIMAKYVKPNMLLIPMANHVGYATYTKILADEIAKLSGAQVLDVMKGKERDTFYDIKAGGGDVNKEQLGLYLTAEIPKGKQVLIIDNVVSTGNTAAAAIDLIPNSIMFAYADVGNTTNNKVEGLRNVTQEYLNLNSIIMDNKLQWFETYLAAQEKLDFEKAEQAYKEIPALRRLFTAAPKDPMPGMSAQDLAESYVREFKQAYYPEIKINEPIHLNNGARITIDFEYQKENLQPVLSLTHDDNGMVYQERKAFEKDGTAKEWGIVYPLSETGITGRLENFSSSYNAADKKTVLETQKVFDNMIEGISNSLKENVAKEIDLANIFVNQQSLHSNEDIRLRKNDLIISGQIGGEGTSIHYRGDRKFDDDFTLDPRSKNSRVNAETGAKFVSDNLIIFPESQVVNELKGTGRGDLEQISFPKPLNHQQQEKVVEYINNLLKGQEQFNGWNSLTDSIVDIVNNNAIKQEKKEQVGEQTQQKQNVEDIAKSFGFKKEFSNDTVILMNKEVSVDLDKYIKYELAINTKTGKFGMDELHNTSIDNNSSHDITEHYHQHYGDNAQLAEKLGQVIGQGQQQNIEQPYAYVGIIHSLDNSTPSVAYTTEHEYLAALEHALKTNPQNLSYETRSENPQLHKQVEDLVKSMETQKQETIQQSLKKDFNYETSSIQPQQQLMDDLQHKFMLAPETVKEFSTFMEAAHPIDKSATDRSADVVVFPYVKVDYEYNLKGHLQSTMSAKHYDDGLTNQTNAIIGYEHYTKGQNIPFLQSSQDATINGGVWMATKATEPQSVNNVILFNSAVDAMSFYEKNKESIDLKDTALISVGRLARDRQIEGIAERFPLAYMQTGFQNTILGKLSDIAVISVASGSSVKFEINDNNSINFTANKEKFSLPLSEINAEIFKEKAHIKDNGIFCNLDNIKINHPQGQTYNADLIQSKQIERHQEQEQNKSYKMKI